MMRDSGNIRDDPMTRRQRKRRFKTFGLYRDHSNTLQGNPPGVEFLRTLFKFRKRMNFDVVVSPRFDVHGHIKVHYS